MYNPGVIEKLWPAGGVIHEGVIHEKNFLADLWPKGYARAKTEDFLKNVVFLLQPKRGLYTQGVIHEALQFLFPLYLPSKTMCFRSPYYSAFRVKTF